MESPRLANSSLLWRGSVVAMRLLRELPSCEPGLLRTIVLASVESRQPWPDGPVVLYPLRSVDNLPCPNLPGPGDGLYLKSTPILVRSGGTCALRCLTRAPTIAPPIPINPSSKTYTIGGTKSTNKPCVVNTFTPNARMVTPLLGPPVNSKLKANQHRPRPKTIPPMNPISVN